MSAPAPCPTTTASTSMTISTPPGALARPPETSQLRTRVRVSGIGATSSVATGRLDRRPGGEDAAQEAVWRRARRRPAAPRVPGGRTGVQGGLARCPPSRAELGGKRGHLFASGSLVSTLHGGPVPQTGGPCVPQDHPDFRMFARCVGRRDGRRLLVRLVHQPRTRPLRSLRAPTAGPAMPFQADPPERLRRQGEEHPRRPAADRRRDRRRSRPTRRSSARSSTAGCSCPSTTQKMLRFFELAFQQTQVTCDRLRRSGLPASRSASTRRRSRCSCRTRRRASRARCWSSVASGQPLTPGDDDAAVHDDDGAEGALRLPRRVGGRRRRQRHRPLQGGAPEARPSPSRRPQGPDPDRARRSTRRARTTCTGTTPTSPPTSSQSRRAAPTDPIIYAGQRDRRCTTCSTARSTAARTERAA